jgi:hypothetical protein
MWLVDFTDMKSASTNGRVPSFSNALLIVRFISARFREMKFLYSALSSGRLISMSAAPIPSISRLSNPKSCQISNVIDSFGWKFIDANWRACRLVGDTETERALIGKGELAGYARDIDKALADTVQSYHIAA